MSKLIDLSLRIEDGMQTHPEDTHVRIIQNKFLKTDNYVNHILQAGMHSGTHIDIPMHGIDSSEYVSEIALDQFIGEGYLINAKNESIVKYKEVYEKEIKEGQIVLVYTGHIKKYGQSAFYKDYPIIDEKLIDLLIKKNVKIIGIDGPSIDKPPHKSHGTLFKKGICIIENLSNLDELTEVKQFEIMAFPLKIKAEASMVRVVAKIL